MPPPRRPGSPRGKGGLDWKLSDRWTCPSHPPGWRGLGDGVERHELGEGLAGLGQAQTDSPPPAARTTSREREVFAS